MQIKSNNGFTIELMMVIATVLILIIAFSIAIDPFRRFDESRNAQRWDDIMSISDAIYRYKTDNNDSHYSTLAALTVGIYYPIGTCSSGGDSGCKVQSTQSTCVDISGMGLEYLPTVPMDPKIGTSEKTGYYLMINSNGTVDVGACNTEGEGVGGSGIAPIIAITR